MTATSRDVWSEWLLHRRFGDPRRRPAAMTVLHPVRDRVLDHARPGEGEVLLDIGSGEGLIAFGALEREPGCRVIVSDISRDLLAHAEETARAAGLCERCRFLEAPATDLSVLPDGSVDAVTARSVLVYVADKQRAFDEFHRVLRPGGRLSIFEPVFRSAAPSPDHCFWGYDAAPVWDLAVKVLVACRLRSPDTSPMFDFTERNLLAFAERAGFPEFHLELRVDVGPPAERVRWGAFVRVAPTPKSPTLAEAIEQALTPDEAERFIAHLRPLVEARQGTERTALAYLWATKR